MSVNRAGTDAPEPASACSVYIVDPGRSWPRRVREASRLPACYVRSARDVARHFRGADRKAVWVASDPSYFRALAQRHVPPSGERRLVLLDAVSETTRHALSAWFRHVVVGGAGITLLPARELLEVLLSPNRDELFIGGAVDPAGRAVVLYRGNVEPVVVPLEWFDARPSGPSPDASAFEVTDYGHTIRLGEYEAAADAILYEFDPEYRRKARARAVQEDPTLGGSIRRLRLQRGLSRTDFPGVPDKTLARIERNEVARPHRRTLERIAERLGVSVEALGTF